MCQKTVSHKCMCMGADSKAAEAAAECAKMKKPEPDAIPCKPDLCKGDDGDNSTDDKEDDKDKPTVVLKLVNSRIDEKETPSWGVVLGAEVAKVTDKVEDKDWAYLCNDGFGRNEANALCRYLGYKVGIQIRADWAIKELQDRPFGATNIKCSETAKGPNECKFDMEEDAEVPCFADAGYELAVACSNEKFTFKIEKTVSKFNKKGKGKFVVLVTMEKFGIGMSAYPGIQLIMFNRSQDGKYTLLKTKFKFNRKHDVWKGRGMKPKEISKENSCIIYVAGVTQHHWATKIGECGYKGLTEEKVWQEMDKMDWED